MAGRCRSPPPPRETGKTGEEERDTTRPASGPAGRGAFPIRLAEVLQQVAGARDGPDRSNPQQILRAVRGLDLAPWRVLQFLFLTPDLASLNALFDPLRRLAGGPEAAWSCLSELERLGLVVVLRQDLAPYDRPVRDLYLLLPPRVRVAAARRWAGELLDQGLARALPEPAGRELADPDPLQDDLFDLVTLLAWLDEAPRRLTQAGVLYKREQARVLQRFRRPEPVRQGPEQEYPLGLGVLLDYATGEGLVSPVQEGSESWLATTPLAEQWAVRPYPWRRSRYHGYWWQRLLEQGDLSPLFHLLLALPAGHGLAWAELMSRWGAIHRDPGRVQALRGRLLRLTPLLERLAILRAPDGVPGAGDPQLLVALPPPLPHGPGEPEEPDEGFIVQPNFEVLVSQEAPSRRLWQLYRCAELVRADRMMVFRLTEQSLLRAVATGIPGPELIRFLERHARFPLPENVRYSLDEWVGAAGRVRLVEAVLLECDDPALAGELERSTPLRPHLLEAVGARHFLVDLSTVDELRAKLSKAGLTPLPGFFQRTAAGWQRSRGLRRLRPASPAPAGAAARAVPPLADWERFFGGDPSRPATFEGYEALQPAPLPDPELPGVYRPAGLERPGEGPWAARSGVPRGGKLATGYESRRPHTAPPSLWQQALPAVAPADEQPLAVVRLGREGSIQEVKVYPTSPETLRQLLDRARALETPVALVCEEGRRGKRRELHVVQPVELLEDLLMAWEKGKVVFFSLARVLGASPLPPVP